MGQNHSLRQTTVIEELGSVGAEEGRGEHVPTIGPQCVLHNEGNNYVCLESGQHYEPSWSCVGRTYWRSHHVSA
jgi:hypothetical protein